MLTSACFDLLPGYISVLVMIYSQLKVGSVSSRLIE